MGGEAAAPLSQGGPRAPVTGGGTTRPVIGSPRKPRRLRCESGRSERSSSPIGNPGPLNVRVGRAFGCKKFSRAERAGSGVSGASRGASRPERAKGGPDGARTSCGAVQQLTEATALRSARRCRSVVRGRGCAGDGASAATDGGPCRRARGATDRERHNTSDGRSDTGARRSAG